jgi:hypothetical protein
MKGKRPRAPITGWRSDHVPGAGKRWAGSVINAQVRHLYNHGGGFIIRPHLGPDGKGRPKLFCAYPADGNSQGERCPGTSSGCKPGCSRTCTTDLWGCSFPPDRLQDALQAQLDKGHVRSHNEVVFDVEEIKSHLPNSIQAVFYMSTSSNRERAAAQKAHADFLKAYGQSEHDIPMVVIVDLRTEGNDAPFVLEDDWICTAWCPNDGGPINPFLHPELAVVVDKSSWGGCHTWGSC